MPFIVCSQTRQQLIPANEFPCCNPFGDISPAPFTRGAASCHDTDKIHLSCGDSLDRHAGCRDYLLRVALTVFDPFRRLQLRAVIGALPSRPGSAAFAP